MLLVDDWACLFKNRKSYTFEDYLKSHLNHVHDLQYQTGTEISKVCKYLSSELSKYAISHSPIYTNHKGIIDKSSLNGPEWYTNRHPFQKATTGGSTTGKKFHYLRWADTYEQIEKDAHYKAILSEFDLDKPIQILYLMLDLTNERSETKLTKIYKTSNILISHGQGQQAMVHEVMRNRTYYTDYYKFYEDVFNYCVDHKIDVILAPGQAIASLAWNARRLKISTPICSLLSNTGNKVSIGDPVRIVNQPYKIGRREIRLHLYC